MGEAQGSPQLCPCPVTGEQRCRCLILLLQDPGLERSSLPPAQPPCSRNISVGDRAGKRGALAARASKDLNPMPWGGHAVGWARHGASPSPIPAPGIPGPLSSLLFLLPGLG